MMMAQQQQQAVAAGHGHPHPHGSATMRPGMNTHTLGRLPSHQHHSHHSPQHNGKYATLSRECKTLQHNDFY